jgi:hypothetical protein
VLTTFTSYGAVARNRQAEIMRELGGPKNPPVPIEDLLRQLAEAYRGNSAAIEVSREQGEN